MIAARFWAKVDRSGGPDACWPWTAAVQRKGYGWFRGPNSMLAHRNAWELTHGPIPDGFDVCHHCDNPPCCNPAHLFLGTHADNNADRETKGRTVVPNGLTGLTEDELSTIRDRYAAGGVSQRSLAVEFGVAQSTISLAVRTPEGAAS